MWKEKWPLHTRKAHGECQADEAVCGRGFASILAAAFLRFYDFNVWSEGKLREKLLYMHRNPVERKLVAHPKDWPWSSWSHYEKGEQGMLHIDKLLSDQECESGEQERRPKNSKPAP